MLTLKAYAIVPSSLRFIERSCRQLSGSTNGLQFVKIEYVDDIAIVKLNDSARLNAMTVEMGRDFNQALNVVQLAADEQRVRSVIITGEGKAFSAGGDLDWLMNRHNSSSYKNSLTMQRFYNYFLDVRKLSVPTIAALNGSAVGAGMAMSLACDVRIASTSGKFGFTFPSLGIHPGMGSSLLLQRVSSYETAAHLLYSGMLVDGNEAKRLNLVLEAVAADKVLETAIAHARTYNSNSPIAVQSCTKTLRDRKFAGMEQALTREADAQAMCYASSDFVRGVAAMKDRKSNSSAVFLGWDE